MASTATTADPSAYRPTCAGWDEYKKQLPAVLRHLALKLGQPTLDWARFVQEMPWPILDPQHPMRGAFLLQGSYFYIPCKFRLQHNEPIFYETKGHFVAEVRSEHPNLPGRSTSTLKARVDKKTGEFDLMLPFIPKAIELEEFTLSTIKRYGHGESYVLQEFLPHIQDLGKRVELLRELKRKLDTNWATDVRRLVPTMKLHFETDRDSIKVRVHW